MTPDMKDCSWDGVCGDGGAPHEEGGGGDGRGSQGVQRRRHGLQEGGAESYQLSDLPVGVIICIF